MNLLTALFIARVPDESILRRSEQHRAALRTQRAQAKHELVRELESTDSKTKPVLQSTATRARVLPGVTRVTPVVDDGTVAVAPAHRRAVIPPALQHAATRIVTWRSERFPSVSFDSLVLCCVMASLVFLTLETHTGWTAPMRTLLAYAEHLHPPPTALV
jgi:hypothetical protein